jgi:hypothetical protein
VLSLARSTMLSSTTAAPDGKSAVRDDAEDEGGRLAAVGCVMHLCNQPLDHQRLAILAAMPRLALDWLLRAYQKAVCDLPG